MKSKIPFGLAMMLVALLLSLIPAASITVQHAQALSTCDAAQFVADVTIPDNSVIVPGSAFVKTWRLRNTGVCVWNTSYTLVFVSGEKMSGPDSVLFPKTVPPGQTVDLSVNLVAPNASGTFRGNWQLKNSAGALFGIGTSHANPFWVQIKVTSSTQNITAYDFVDNMCSAQWSYDGGPIPCPINTNKLLFGYVQKVDNPVMENGVTSPIHGLLTIPQNKFNGLIRGSFPVTDIFRGDHFQATVGCQFNAVNCFVTYELELQSGSSLITLWKWKEKYDGLVTQADVDLTQIAGRKNARLVLTILATGPFEGDQPLWVAPRIVHASGGPLPTPTPGSPTSVVPTVVPTSASGCDRAQFVTDVTVPDGTTFAPNAAFTKTWRLKNVGTCTWTTAYSLVLASGDRMSAPDSLLPVTVVPGQTVDLGINLTAPSVAGSYRGYWQLKNAAGSLFGIGTNADSPFFVDIKVSGTLPSTSTPTPTNTTAPATGMPTFTPTPTQVPATGTPTQASVTPTLVQGLAIPHLVAGQAFDIMYIHMVDVDQGWGIGGLAQAEDHVFRTQTGGKTWHDVTPPQPAPAAGAAVAALGYFADASNGWVAYGPPAGLPISPTSILVWFTHDGGASWMSGVINTIGTSSGYFSPWYLNFADSQHGWLLVLLGGGMSHVYVALYSTSDGGTTWTDILDPYMVSSIQAFTKTGMIFMDMHTGWLTRDADGVDNIPHTFITRDAGVTWTRINLPAPSGTTGWFDNNYCGTYSPVAFSTQSALFTMKCRENTNPTAEHDYLYSTGDGGQTWQSVPLPSAFRVADPPSGGLFFTDALTGLALGRWIYLTQDGGKTWSTVKQVTWDGQFNFLTLNTGWAVARNAGQIALVNTVDGGRSWQEIKPVVAP